MKRICIKCNKVDTFKSKQNISKLCSSCRAKKRIKQHGNPMKGKKQDPNKFRSSYINVDYTKFKLNKRNKRLYKMNCITCGANRGYKIHNEAKRSCLKCHTKKYKKRSQRHRKIYDSMKANINAKFNARK